jgi:hypothetical protein
MSLCRVLFVEHSTKSVLSADKTLGKKSHRDDELYGDSGFA